jgi:hypothetical protein
LNELVLLIPAVIVLLGDNPMQSEFACHIGLRGKYFCRACWVKGSENLDEPEDDELIFPAKPPNTGTSETNASAGNTENPVGTPAEGQTGIPASTQPSTAVDAEPTTPLGSEAVQPVETRPETPASSEAGSDATINTSEKKSRGKRVKESLDQMMTRAKAFVKVSHYICLVCASRTGLRSLS